MKEQKQQKKYTIKVIEETIVEIKADVNSDLDDIYKKAISKVTKKQNTDTYSAYANVQKIEII